MFKPQISLPRLFIRAESMSNTERAMTDLCLVTSPVSTIDSHVTIEKINDEKGGFTLFSSLPIELRIKIYRYIDSVHPSHVLVTVVPGSPSSSITPHFKLLTPSPIALHICHESREAVQKHYILALPGIDGNIGSVWINPKKHTLAVRIPMWDCEWMLQVVRHSDADIAAAFVDNDVETDASGKVIQTGTNVWDAKKGLFTLVTRGNNTPTTFLEEESFVIVCNHLPSPPEISEREVHDITHKAVREAMAQFGIMEWQARFIAHEKQSDAAGMRVLNGWGEMWKDHLWHLADEDEKEWHWHGQVEK